MYCHKKMKTTKESSLEVLKEILPKLEAQEDYSNDALYQLLVDFVAEKGCKNGYVMWPVRTAVSGKQMTPAGATEIMEVLGKEESIARIQAAIEKVKQGSMSDQILKHLTETQSRAVAHREGPCSVPGRAWLRKNHRHHRDRTKYLIGTAMEISPIGNSGHHLYQSCMQWRCRSVLHNAMGEGRYAR